jgi:transcriptional regulator with XRE-family HTH domain
MFPVVAYSYPMTSTRTRLAHGPAIRAIREALGINHGEFALRCNMSPGYLTNIESGRKQPSPAVAKRIAEELGITLDAITYPIRAESKDAA